MIEVIYSDGKFLAKGTFSLGIAGVFENKDFNDKNIEIQDTLQYILEELEKEDSFAYQPLFPYLKGLEKNGASIARGLADYYNQKEIEAQQNIKQINDCILCNLFEHLEDCEYPFWEIEQAIVPRSLNEQNIDSIYDTEENVYEWADDFYRKPNNGTISKTDVEGKLREMFPMFNFDGLYQSIIPEVMVLNGRFIEFQFSDSWGGDLFCCASDCFDENFTSCDWHNH